MKSVISSDSMHKATLKTGQQCGVVVTAQEKMGLQSGQNDLLLVDVRLNNLRVVESGTNQYQLQVQPGHNEDWKMCSFPDGFNVSNWIYNQYITTESYNMASAKDRLGRLYHVNVTRETRDVQWNVLRERYLGVLCSCILDYFWP